MELYLQEKLANKVEHYQDKDFLKPAMAAFVDGPCRRLHGSVERYQIDETLKTEPGLRKFDFEKATQILESYAKASTTRERQPRTFFPTKQAEWPATIYGQERSCASAI